MPNNNNVFRITDGSKNKVVKNYSHKNAQQKSLQLDQAEITRQRLYDEKDRLTEEAFYIENLAVLPTLKKDFDSYDLLDYELKLNEFQQRKEDFKKNYTNKIKMLEKAIQAIEDEKLNQKYYVLKNIAQKNETVMATKVNLIGLSLLEKQLNELEEEEVESADILQAIEHLRKESKNAREDIAELEKLKKNVAEKKNISNETITQAMKLNENIQFLPKANELAGHLQNIKNHIEVVKQTRNVTAKNMPIPKDDNSLDKAEYNELVYNIEILNETFTNKLPKRDMIRRSILQTESLAIKKKGLETMPSDPRPIDKRFYDLKNAFQLVISKIWMKDLFDGKKNYVTNQEAELNKTLSTAVSKTVAQLSGAPREEVKKAVEGVINKITTSEEIEDITKKEEVITMGKGMHGMDSDDEYGGDLFHALKTFGLSGVVPKKVSDFLKQWGRLRIGEVKILKNAIDSNVNKLLNLITEGRIEKGKQAINADALFHLYLRLSCYDEFGGLKYVLIEKNNVFNIEFGERPSQYTLVAGNLNKLITLNEFVERAQAEHQVHGIDLYKYDPINANCQIFVDLALDGAKINSQDAKNFTVQDVSRVFDLVSANETQFIRGVVSVGAFFSALME